MRAQCQLAQGRNHEARILLTRLSGDRRRQLRDQFPAPAPSDLQWSGIESRPAEAPAEPAGDALGERIRVLLDASVDGEASAEKPKINGP